MSMMTPLQREKLAYQYTIALDQGDMDSLIRILAIAETDATLEQMILELNQVLESNNLDFQEELMPIFTKSKRKRDQKRPLWTAGVAILISLLFSGFALFFAAKASNQSLSAVTESITFTDIDKEQLARQFLESWNNNNPEILDNILDDDFLYYEDTLMPLNKDETQNRIEQLHESFTEVHFLLEDMIQTSTRLSGHVTLKANHAEVFAINRNYFADGEIEFVFTGNKIIKVTLEINLDRFSAEYGLIRTDAENDMITHVIQEGETMYSIVNQYNIQHTLIPTILEYNGFDGEDGAKSLTTGTVIQIPAPHSALILTPPDNFDTELQSNHIEVTDEEVLGLQVYIDVGQANLRMGALPDTHFMADIENFGDYEYIEHGAQIKRITIINHPYQIFKENGERPTWYSKVSETAFGEYSIRGGNGDMMLDFSNVWLQSLQVTIGEGTLTLNLPNADANIPIVVKTLSDDATVKLSYPTDVALRINANDGIWQSRNFADVTGFINLTLDGSLSVLDMLGD